MEAAQIDGLIASLPDRLETLVGARGHRLSDGWQQQLAIARTILYNSQVLVVDGATSSFDNTAEAQVRAVLDRLAEDLMTITIAHRLSTVEQADQHVVLDGGCIVELGTVAELRAGGNPFARLQRF